MYSLEEKVKWLAIISRCAILTLQIVSNGLIPDHDAGVFIKPFEKNATYTSTDKAINFAFEGLSRWDAQYFLHIAEYGYTYENTLAFFPLFPLLIRQLSNVLFHIFNGVTFLVPWMEPISIHSALLATAVIFNNVLFVKTAITLFDLSLIVLKNKKLAYLSSILFCVNPASIFFSAAYSESLYCFLVFYAMLRIEEKKFFLGSILIGLSGMTRSNGITNIGFIVYAYLKTSINRKLSCRDEFSTLFCLLTSILPFAWYQLYCYLKYCLPGNDSSPRFIRSYGIENNFKFPGNRSVWCEKSIPFAYSYVQSHYWNVGFLRYYQLKQLPNFLLALPSILILLRGATLFVRRHGRSLLYLGFRNSAGWDIPITVFPYLVHSLFLTIFSIFFIHIQVATRLLYSSTPVIYWFGALIVADGIREPDSRLFLKKFRKNSFAETEDNRASKWRTVFSSESFRGVALLVIYYHFVYLILGTLMFSNFLPWT